MITLDMSKKKAVIKIPHNVFSMENKILTLEISVGDYDLTSKTITAIFNPSKVETAPLEEIDGVIKIPIHANMVKYGLNYIQLNFRWGDDYLEQSPIMSWYINKSLPSSAPAQEAVDIITYLINENNEAIAKEQERQEAERQREEGESNRNTAYTQAEGARDAAYIQAENERDALFEEAELHRVKLHTGAEEPGEGYMFWIDTSSEVI